MKDNNNNHEIKLDSLKAGKEELNFLISLQSIKVLQNLNNQLNPNKNGFLYYKYMNLENSRNTTKDQMNYSTIYSKNAINNFIFEKSPAITDNFYFEDPAKPSLKHTITSLGGCNVNIFNDNNMNLMVQSKINTNNSFVKAIKHESPGKTITNSSMQTLNRGKLSETFNINNFFLYSPSSINSFKRTDSTKRTESENGSEKTVLKNKMNNNLFDHSESDFLGKKTNINSSVEVSKNKTLNEIKLKLSEQKEIHPLIINKNVSNRSVLPKKHTYSLIKSNNSKNDKCKNTKAKQHNLKLSCSHSECDFELKTNRQITTHHNRFEFECKTDKYSIIKLILFYKQVILGLMKESNRQNEKNIKLIENLKIELENVNNQLRDNDYFITTVGEKFEDLA